MTVQAYNRLNAWIAHQNIVTSMLVQATKMTSSSSDDWIY
jgi:hypothetical protein